VAWLSLPKRRAKIGELLYLDAASLLLGAAALAAIEIAMKEAPGRGWTSPLVTALLGLFLLAAAVFTFRMLRSPMPLVNLRTFGNRNFAIGCLLSFVLGMGLFGSVYLMPVFLAYVRGHDALQIGEIMLVTGVAQLAAAPLAAAVVRRCDDRLLSALGFLLFAAGLALSSVQTRDTDFDGMFWPQLLRGCAIMFCILPPTELALGQLAEEAIPDASGLFNMMRNLGGAIGIAIIDTVVYSHAPEHARNLIDRLMTGDLNAVRTLGVSLDDLTAALVDAGKKAEIASLIDKVSFVEAVNDAWEMMALIALASLLVLPWARTTPRSERIVRY
jgi:DHA2 family multidrug resistance protein